MVVIVVVLAVWLLIVLAPETPIGSTLKRHLVDRPALRCNRVSGGQAALVAAVVVAGLLATWIGGGDGARMTGMAMPDVAMWLASAELTAYLDVAVAAAAGWAVLRAQGLRGKVGSVFSLVWRPGPVRVGARTTRRTPPRAVNDNGPEEPRRRAA